MATVTPVSPLCLAYYCSGHGYGHATRVSAFTRYLLSGSPKDRPIVHIVSSAPVHVFSDSISCGARYRYAEIDPVIVQPLAYRVDRRQSVEVLKKFLSKKEELLERECKWLVEINAQGVLSDAAFLGCLAAQAAGVPSILITNFSFDSVYSYLSTPFLDISPASQSGVAHSILDMLPDIPISHAELAPLVDQIHAGYRCADLLVRLPGYIPIPSFFVEPKLPSSEWIDNTSRRIRPEILDKMQIPCPDSPTSVLLPCLQPKFPLTHGRRANIERTIIDAPLLVRPPSADLSVYTPAGRSKLLSSIGVPLDLHDESKTKILIVSFGGQVFRPPPSRASSRSHSRNASHENLASLMSTPVKSQSPSRVKNVSNTELQSVKPGELNVDPSRRNRNFQENILSLSLPFDLHIPASPGSPTPNGCSNNIRRGNGGGDNEQPVSRLATPNHIWIPGAPPASKPLPTPTPAAASNAHPTSSNNVMMVGVIPTVNTIPPTPGYQDFEVDPHSLSFSKVQESERQQDCSHEYGFADPDDANSSSNSSSDSSSMSMDTDSDTDVDIAANQQLLPDASWIAIVCGVSKEQWMSSQEETEEGLPEGFYVAPRDVYMPDLTAVGDVLLGKLGYGTVAECVDACTPFVYVSRPLFIEEHGLRLLLDAEGVGVELSRQSYEAGDWACAVAQAMAKGSHAKEMKRRIMASDSCGNGTDRNTRDLEGRILAGRVVDWVKGWWGEEVGEGLKGACGLDKVADL